MAIQGSAQPRKTGNRQRLIDAALDAIAEVGIPATSVSEVVKRAGLSRGMIHLHFNGKEALMAEAARHAGALYYEVLDRHLDAAPGDPAGRIRAVVASDLSPEVMSRRTVGIWYELRGAARTSPAIAAHSDTRGGRLEEVLSDAFRALDPAQDSQAATDAMRATIALLEGTWTDFMLHPEGYDTQAARRMVFRVLRGLYPGAF